MLIKRIARLIISITVKFLNKAIKLKAKEAKVIKSAISKWKKAGLLKGSEAEKIWRLRFKGN